MSVIIISFLLLCRSLVAQDEKEQQPDQSRVQRLEQRVHELEKLLENSVVASKAAAAAASSSSSKRMPELHPTKNFQQHPLDVKFLNYKDRKRILITGGAG